MPTKQRKASFQKKGVKRIITHESKGLDISNEPLTNLSRCCLVVIAKKLSKIHKIFQCI